MAERRELAGGDVVGQDARPTHLTYAADRDTGGPGRRELSCRIDDVAYRYLRPDDAVADLCRRQRIGADRGWRAWVRRGVGVRARRLPCKESTGGEPRRREGGDPLATAGRELLRIGGHVSPCATGLTQLALCADLLRQLHTPVMRSAGSDWPTDVARPVNRAA